MSNFMSEGEQQRQRQNRANMENQNNNNNLINQNVAEQKLAYLAHDLDRPIRSYVSPNFYDINSSIAYLMFSENARFEIKPVML